MLNRQSRLLKMEEALKMGLNAKGDNYTQYQAINTIIRHAWFSGEPVLEWLLLMGQQLNQPQEKPVSSRIQRIMRRRRYQLSQPTDVAPPTFVCHKCADKPAFKSQKALNGHMKKHIG